MKIKLDRITSDPHGLHMGVQIHGPKDSWLRFGRLFVPWEEVPQRCLDDWQKWQDRDELADELDTPLLFEDD